MVMGILIVTIGIAIIGRVLKVIKTITITTIGIATIVETAAIATLLETLLPTLLPTTFQVVTTI